MREVTKQPTNPDPTAAFSQQIYLHQAYNHLILLEWLPKRLAGLSALTKNCGTGNVRPCAHEVAKRQGSRNENNAKSTEHHKTTLRPTTESTEITKQKAQNTTETTFQKAQKNDRKHRNTQNRNMGKHRKTQNTTEHHSTHKT